MVVATRADYEVAYKVLTMTAPRVLESCSPKARKVFTEILKPAFEKSPNGILKTRAIQALINEPASTVARWLRDYVKDELLIRDGKDTRQNLYCLNKEVSEFTTQDIGLVPPERLRSMAWGV